MQQIIDSLQNIFKKKRVEIQFDEEILSAYQ